MIQRLGQGFWPLPASSHAGSDSGRVDSGASGHGVFICVLGVSALTTRIVRLLYDARASCRLDPPGWAGR